MSFVNPWFLFALSAAAIPIIIHLFHFRRFRKVFFSNIHFLEELSEEKRKRSRLRNILVLLSRLLVVIFLVLAFSRPYIPQEDADISHEGNALSVYVDNSFSMEALAPGGRLIDEAKMLAAEIADAFPAADDYHILTNDFEGRHQRFVNREDFISFIHEIELSPRVRTLSQIYKRQKEMLNQSSSANKSIFILSDFQKNISDFENFAVDTSISAYFVPLKSQRSDNVFIDSLWFESPVKLADQPVTVNVVICNDGSQSLENQSIRLYVNDVLRTVAGFDIQPGETLEKQLSFTVNDDQVQQGRVEIVDYPVVFDDKKYFSFQVTENIPVTVVNQSVESRYLNALFDDDDTFDYRNMSLLNIDYSAFQYSDILILNGLNSISSGLSLEVNRFVKEGGSLVVFPGDNIEPDSYKNFLTSLNVNYYEPLDTNTYHVSSLNDMHPLFYGVFEEVPENVDLPVAYKHYQISSSVSGTEDYLMQLQNGNNLFTSQNSEAGKVYLSAVPLNEEFSNFPLHPVFVPTLYNAALYSVPRTKPYEVIGGNTPIQIRHIDRTRDPVYKLRANEMEIIPEVRRIDNRVNLYIHDQVERAGNYLLFSDGNLIDGISFNYDRRESKMDVYDAKTLENKIDDHQIKNANTLDLGDVSFDKAFERFSMGRELWHICLILALVFILAEILLLRFWK